MGMQGIGTHDPPFHIQRTKQLLHPRLSTFFVGNHLFFEHHSGPRFIQTDLVHLLLVCRFLFLCSAQRLAIQGHMLLLPWLTFVRSNPCHQ